MELIETHGCFGGIQSVYAHYSPTTKCTMRFGLFLPPQAQKHKVPVVYWLSGLTCNEQNFITKAGAQRTAAELGLALVTPDTSPRGVDVPGDNASYDLGLGAGFYVDATELPWSTHYQMASYVSEELPPLLAQAFPLDKEAVGLFGHSMGGHGALTLALKKPKQFRSVSAFSPICAPTHCSWGQNAFTHYLGKDKTAWQAYDACALIKTRGWANARILIDQGEDDPYLKEQLKPELFQEACLNASVNLTLRMHKGYDHSYYFIASFIDSHLAFHANYLREVCAR
ncbi:MAG: S-formylglutathione hydrolase [Tatlockia sp.]